MTSSKRPDESELLAWRGMLRIVVRARLEMGRRLEQRHELTMAEYDVLVPLAHSPQGRMRMAELAEVVLQPKSSLTRLVGGLERRGYVRRESTSEDGRGVAAVLTPLGAERFRAAQADHHAAIAELVTGRLTRAQLTQLRAAWRDIEPDIEN